MAKARARANGEGTIFKRTRGGIVRWYCELVIGYEGGKKKVLRHSADTRKEVADRLAEWQQDRNKGILVEPSKQTVAAYLDHWTTTVVAHNCKPTTQNTYAWIVDKHLKPGLGSLQLSKITPAHVQSLYHERLKEGLSPLTVRSIHMVLHRALEHAKRQGMVAVNVTDMVERPKVRRQEMAVLTPEEGRRFLEAAEDDRFHALYVLALTVGLRQGELLGLRWSDIDWEAGTLTVRQTLSDIKGKLIFNTPKSSTSRRTIDMPPTVVMALRKWRSEQNQERLRIGEAWADYDLVFTTQVGTPFSPNNLRKRSFVDVMTRAGLVEERKIKQGRRTVIVTEPKIRFHDLRHTAITAMGAMGLTPKEAQELAGHSNVSTTLGIYIHVWQQQKKAAAQKINDFWTTADKKAR